MGLFAPRDRLSSIESIQIVISAYPIISCDNAIATHHNPFATRRNAIATRHNPFVIENIQIASRATANVLYDNAFAMPQHGIAIVAATSVGETDRCVSASNLCFLGAVLGAVPE